LLPAADTRGRSGSFLTVPEHDALTSLIVTAFVEGFAKVKVNWAFVSPGLAVYSFTSASATSGKGCATTGTGRLASVETGNDGGRAGCAVKFVIRAMAVTPLALVP